MPFGIYHSTQNNTFQPNGESSSQFVTGSLEGRSVQELKDRLAEIQKTPIYQTYLNLQNTAPKYEDQITTRHKVTAIVLIAIVIGSLVTFGLFASNHLFSLPQDFLHLFHHVNYIKLAVGVGVPLILLAGAGIVIYRAIHKRETLLGKHDLKVVTYVDQKKTKTVILGKNEPSPEGAQEIQSDREGTKVPKRGAFADIKPYLETAYVTCEAWADVGNYYVDMSTVDESGKALMYVIKDCSNHYHVSTIVPFLVTPAYMIGSIVYNLLRTIIVPFYVLIQLLREKCSGERIYTDKNERAFSLTDIPKEMGKSIWQAVTAPFFAVAYLFAGIFSLVNPMGGRKLGNAIERDWNRGVTLENGYWSVGGKGKFWAFEGGGSPNKLGHNGGYLAGCWQPTGYVIFDENGEVLTAYRMEAAIDHKKEKPLQVILRSKMEADLAKDLTWHEVLEIKAQIKKLSKKRR